MNPDPLQPDPIIPPRLAEAIRRHELGRGGVGGVGGVDLSVLDRGVLDAAAGVLGSRRRGRWAGGRLWRIGVPLAAAAGLALAVHGVWPRAGTGAAPVVAFDAGRPITILEAFQLARLLKGSTGTVSPTWDVTGDGAVDQRDVEALAERAVRLGGSEGHT